LKDEDTARRLREQFGLDTDVLAKAAEAFGF